MKVKLVNGELYVGNHKVAHLNVPARGFIRLWQEGDEAEVWVFPTLRLLFKTEDGLPKPVLCQVGETLVEVSPDSQASPGWSAEVPASVQLWWDAEEKTLRIEGVTLYLEGIRKAFRALFPDAFRYGD